MTVQLAALAICIGVFAVGLYRHINVGILSFTAACAVGVWLAQIPIQDVIEGYPVDLFLLLAGVTFFFGVAQANGTIKKLIDSALRKVGDRVALLPLVFFCMSAAIGSMGNPAASFVIMPIGMNVAQRRGIDPSLMAIAMGTGMSAGGFAPTSMFGIIVYGTAREANIAMSPVLLFVVALTVNLILLAAAHTLFGRQLLRSARSPQRLDAELLTIGADRTADVGTEQRIPASGGGSSEPGSRAESGLDPPPGADGDTSVAGEPFTAVQRVTILAMVALVGTVVIANAIGASPDLGVLTFALGAVLVVFDPKSCGVGISKIDWGTILLVCGIITYVNLLDTMGAIDLLGKFAAAVSIPLLAAVLICLIAGLVSAFASTLAMLAVLVPLAAPLVVAGGIPGWALIFSIAICASIVDVSPISSSGAMMVATYPDPEGRPRLIRILMRWGLTMVIVGPIALVGTLVLPAMAL
jgi:di/tricarboxylate transporter